MFKVIPGNLDYEISLSGEIRRRDGVECTLHVSNGKVLIEFYGILRQIDIGWLSLYSHYEVKLPEVLRDKFLNIHFVPANPYLKTAIDGKIMVFTKPIIVDDGFRLVPNFTRYAINKYGDLISVEDFKRIRTKNRYDETNTRYASVDIYCPSRNKYRSIQIHRLVALAWVSNNDYVEKYLINHKDGVKLNNYYTNLEWTNYRGNAIHAFQNGLRTDNIPCKLRDVETGKIYEFSSMSEAIRELDGLNRLNTNAIKFRNSAKLVGDRYEVRIKGDDRPWFYEKRENGKVGRYNLHITEPDGIKKLCTDVRTFKRLYGVWNISNVWELKTKAEEMYPGMSIEIEDTHVNLPVQAMELSTGKIIEASGIRQLTRLIPVRYSAINSSLNKDPNKAYHGYAFRYKSDEEWDISQLRTTSSKSKCILATNPETKETIVYDSLRDAERKLGVDRSVIKHRAEKGGLFNGMEFRYKKESN